MSQPAFSALSASCIDPRDLLHAGVIIAAYNHHVRPPFSRAFGRFAATKCTQVRGGRRLYEINRGICSYSESVWAGLELARRDYPGTTYFSIVKYKALFPERRSFPQEKAAPAPNMRSLICAPVSQSHLCEPSVRRGSVILPMSRNGPIFRVTIPFP